MSFNKNIDIKHLSTALTWKPYTKNRYGRVCRFCTWCM